MYYNNHYTSCNIKHIQHLRFFCKSQKSDQRLSISFLRWLQTERKTLFRCPFSKITQRNKRDTFVLRDENKTFGPRKEKDETCVRFHSKITSSSFQLVVFQRINPAAPLETSRNTFNHQRKKKESMFSSWRSAVWFCRLDSSSEERKVESSRRDAKKEEIKLSLRIKSIKNDAKRKKKQFESPKFKSRKPDKFFILFLQVDSKRTVLCSGVRSLELQSQNLF